MEPKKDLQILKALLVNFQNGLKTYRGSKLCFQGKETLILDILVNKIYLVNILVKVLLSI